MEGSLIKGIQNRISSPNKVNEIINNSLIEKEFLKTKDIRISFMDFT
jgi:hypothetical protein